jgi:hypothetical protein
LVIFTVLQEEEEEEEEEKPYSFEHIALKISPSAFYFC